MQWQSKDAAKQKDKVTEDSLPANIDFEPISTIDVGKVWYGSSQDVYVSMATRARELGANVVIQAKRWRQPLASRGPPLMDQGKPYG